MRTRKRVTPAGTTKLEEVVMIDQLGKPGRSCGNLNERKGAVESGTIWFNEICVEPASIEIVYKPVQPESAAGAVCIPVVAGVPALAASETR
jgi:hypothetical protein